MTSPNEPPEIQITGRLENWFYDPHNHVFWGNIEGDTKGRFYDGAHIHTSHLMCHKEAARTMTEGNIIVTRNSTYLLGKPYVTP